MLTYPRHELSVLKLEPVHYSGRNTHGGCAGRDISQNHRIRPNHSLFANGDLAEDDCACTDADCLHQRWRVAECIASADPECAVLTQDTSVANDARSVNYNSSLVLNNHATADLG